MYLLHTLARHVAKIMIEKTGIRFDGDLFLLCLAITLVAAELSFRFFERPFLRLKDRFRQPEANIS